jgi:replication factor A1
VDSFLIKARCTFKGDLRTYQNDRGEGKVFSIEILDQHGGEIRCTMFNEQADKFYSMLEVGEIYEFSGGRVKVANKRYQRCDNDFTLTFDYSTEIVKVNDDGDIGVERLNVTKISEIPNLPDRENVDILAIVSESGLTEEIQLRTGETKARKNCTLVDASGFSVRITFWGDTCHSYEVKEGNIIGLKCA